MVLFMVTGLQHTPPYLFRFVKHGEVYMTIILFRGTKISLTLGIYQNTRKSSNITRIPFVVQSLLVEGNCGHFLKLRDILVNIKKVGHARNYYAQLYVCMDLWCELH